MADSIDIISIGEGMIEFSANESLTYTPTLNKSYGGDSLNTLITAARLGSKTGYITRVGNDLFKDFLMDSWQSENIDISNVKLMEGYNGLYFISSQKNGEKEFASYRKKSAATNLCAEDIPEEYIEKASIVYSTGITQSLSSSAREAVKKAFSIAKEKQCTVAYDPNYRLKLWSTGEAKEALDEIIEYIDIILISGKYDSERLFSLTSPDKIIKFFWDRGVSIVAVKSSQNGSFVGYNGEINYIPMCLTNVIDTTGAGDAYNGGFLHGIANGYTPFEAGKLASIVASFQVQGVGAVKPIPYKDQVYNEFKHIDIQAFDASKL